MKMKHIAFCVEPAYGHVIPTLGLASELLRRGHSVSYAVPKSFEPLIATVNARAKIIYPLDNREKMSLMFNKENDCFNTKVEVSAIPDLVKDFIRERTVDSLGQLERLYKDERPDVIVHNAAQDAAGVELAKKWAIPRIRHQTQFIKLSSPSDLQYFEGDELILIAVPELFQQDTTYFDRRFKVVGFSPEGRLEAFDRWQQSDTDATPILVSATTGMLPQIQFCRIMFDTFRDQRWNVVLSIAGRHDTVSAIDPALLPDTPKTIRLNQTCGNFSILEHSCLFIGQGGQGSTLEAIYHGVPQIVIPPTPYHLLVARRVSELGLGLCLPINDLSKESVLEHVTAALQDKDMSLRLKDTALSMRKGRSDELAASLIEDLVMGRS